MARHGLNHRSARLSDCFLPASLALTLWKPGAAPAELDSCAVSVDNPCRGRLGVDWAPRGSQGTPGGLCPPTAGLAVGSSPEAASWSLTVLGGQAQLVFVQGMQSGFHIMLGRVRSAFCGGKSHHMLYSGASEAEGGDPLRFPMI